MAYSAEKTFLNLSRGSYFYMMQQLPDKLTDKLEQRKREGNFRILTGSKGLVDFCSNDYLGFSSFDQIIEGAHRLLREYCISLNGATGSRLISGNHSLYELAESIVARTHMAQKALIFNSGYDANLGLLGSLPQRTDVVFYDEQVHASIRDGLQLSNARKYRFGHNDLKALERLLQTHSGDTCYVVTESVFSMDGDSPDLTKMADLCERHQARLIVDEAHAIGISQKGLVADLELQDQVFARVVTFSKALGCHGAAVLGSEELVDFLVNFARSFIYTTALPPHSVASIIEAYRFLNSDKGRSRIESLQEVLRYYTQLVADVSKPGGFLTTGSAIQGYLCSGNTKVGELSDKLANEGFDVRAIRYPTVPQGSERLRIVLHSFNTRSQLLRLVGLLTEWSGINT